MIPVYSNRQILGQCQLGMQSDETITDMLKVGQAAAKQRTVLRVLQRQGYHTPQATHHDGGKVESQSLRIHRPSDALRCR